MFIDLYPPGNALPSLFWWQPLGFDVATTRGTVEWPWDFLGLARSVIFATLAPPRPQFVQ